ncbi:MAG: hypothetical protein K6G26_02090 [Lachnospiraceae bacterium]|nr:hypothetical protein [Lachnospiraceae bacterium]
MKLEFTDNGTVYRSECLSSPNGYVYKEDDIIEICYDENNKKVCFDNYAKSENYAELENGGITVLGIFVFVYDLFAIWLLIML